MEVDRTFLLLCGGEVLVGAAGNLAAALVLQAIVLAAFLGDLRGYPVFAAGMIVFAAAVYAAGSIALLGLAVALGCGYHYRLARRAGERA